MLSQVYSLSLCIDVSDASTEMTPGIDNRVLQLIPLPFDAHMTFVTMENSHSHSESIKIQIEYLIFSNFRSQHTAKFQDIYLRKQFCFFVIISVRIKRRSYILQKIIERSLERVCFICKELTKKCRRLY